MRKPRSPRRPGSGPEAPAQLLRSPRATLVFFGAIGLLLWGRLLLKEVPQTASAVDPPAAVSAPAPPADPPAAQEKKPTRGGPPAGQVGS